MNILTFDIEDWFCHDNYSQDFNWHKHEVRIHNNVDFILEELDQNNLKGTFFCLGWIAEHQPEIVKKIHSYGHQIGCHSYQHQLAFRFDYNDFFNDTERAQKLLEDLIGEKVSIYRAPSFSITKSNLYAFEILVKLGFEIDCSVFPALRECGGLPAYFVSEPAYIVHEGVKIKEFPINLISFLNMKIVFSGGGYFRVLPYWATKFFSSKSNYIMAYFHPSDFDPGKPAIKHLPAFRRWKNWVGINKTSKKFSRFIKEIDFVDLRIADKLMDWNNAKSIYLK